MTTMEILWMVHEETFEYLKREDPKKVRKYLTSMGDEASLLVWDREQMKSTSTG